MIKLFLRAALPLFLCAWLFSCNTSKPLQYFEAGVDTSQLDQIHVPDPVIKRGDLLSIMIYSDNPEATAIYNQASGTSNSMSAGTGMTIGAPSPTTTAPGYMVDVNGNIRLHEIGTMQVEGLTKEQLSDQIVEKLKKIEVLKNPYCIIRFLNFKITVLGEVKNQGVFTLPGEKASIFEALGLAGDITSYGRKDNVILIREAAGKRSYAKLDISKQDVITSPYFYLQQNDVIIVAADKKKTTPADEQTLRYITVGATVVSSIAILLTLILNN